VDVHSENVCPLLGIEPMPHVVFADDGTYGSSASQRLNQLSYVTQILKNLKQISYYFTDFGLILQIEKIKMKEISDFDAIL
jgi:hypothetical protein